MLAAFHKVFSTVAMDEITKGWIVDQFCAGEKEVLKFYSVIMLIIMVISPDPSKLLSVPNTVIPDGPRPPLPSNRGPGQRSSLFPGRPVSSPRIVCYLLLNVVMLIRGALIRKSNSSQPQ